MKTTRKMLSAMLCCVAAMFGCTKQVDRMSTSPDGQEAESEGDGATGTVVCEDTEYTRDEFNAAFETARQELHDKGYEVAPLIWEDEEHFVELLDHMVTAFGCTPEDVDQIEQSSRRNGPSICRAITDLTSFSSTAFYCGPGAWEGSWLACVRDHRLRVNPNECLSHVCYNHDRCYDDLMTAQGPICLWSDDTVSCDSAFHQGALACFAEPGQCGFWCMAVEVIAANLDFLQNKASLAGRDCLYGAIECSEGAQRPCGTDTGACRASTQTCVVGHWSACAGEIVPTSEICDGLDNDCDGLADETWPALGASCDGSDGDLCQEGVYVCRADGTGVDCTDETGTTDELCGNAIDDDCDGVSDHSAEGGGCLFYAVDLDTGDPSDTATSDLIVVNPSTEVVVVTVEQRLATGTWTAIIDGVADLAPGTAHEFVMADFHMEGSGLYPRGAYRVNSTRPIVAYQVNPGSGAASASSTAAYSLFPVLPDVSCALVGYEYYVLTLPARTNAQSLMTFVGIEDGTLVTFRVPTATTAGPSVAALAAGEAALITIDEGDVLSVGSDLGDLSGAYVVADKPVLLFGHHEGARSTAGDGTAPSGADAIAEQMPSVSAWGTTFVGISLATTEEPSTTWHLVAARSDTVVSFEAVDGCVGLPDAGLILGIGDVAEWSTISTTEAHCRFVITSSAPVLLAQYSALASGGELAMVVVPPVERWSPTQWIIALSGFENRAAIVRSTGAEVLLNGVPLGGPWSVLPGAPFETLVIGTEALGEVSRFQGRCGDVPCGILVIMAGASGESSYAMTAPPIPTAPGCEAYE